MASDEDQETSKLSSLDEVTFSTTGIHVNYLMKHGLDHLTKGERPNFCDSKLFIFVGAISTQSL